MARLYRVSICAGLMVIAAWSMAFAEARIGGVVQKEFNGARGTRVNAAVDHLIFERDIFAGELVTTPHTGSTVLRFDDKTQLQLGRNSSVVLDRFIYDPGAGRSEGTIRFTTGVFRFIGGSGARDVGLKIRTPTATIAIRGTKLVIYVGDDGTTMVGVIEGVAEVTPCGGEVASAAAGEALLVTPACTGAVSVTLASVPTDPATESDYAGETGPAAPAASSEGASRQAAGGRTGGAKGGSTGGGPAAVASASATVSGSGSGSPTASASATASNSISGPVSATASAKVGNSISGNGSASASIAISASGGSPTATVSMKASSGSVTALGSTNIAPGVTRSGSVLAGAVVNSPGGGFSVAGASAEVSSSASGSVSASASAVAAIGVSRGGYSLAVATANVTVSLGSNGTIQSSVRSSTRTINAGGGNPSASAGGNPGAGGGNGRK
jgi:hypothetical protein